jgi:hypothetical protein
MEYARILALIDAEVERLQKARQLIASSFFTPEKPGKRQSLRPVPRAAVEVTRVKELPAAPQVAPPVVASVSPAAAPLAPPAAAVAPVAPVETTVVRRKRAVNVTRRAKPPVSKPATAGFERPLSGAVPAAPVFVSAQQMREIDAQKQAQQAEQNLPGPASKESLTPELLAQRWLRYSAS